MWDLMGLGDQAWSREARCASKVTSAFDPWFAEPTSRARTAANQHGETGSDSLTYSERQAIAICSLCPVQRDCLRDILERPTAIWLGFAPKNKGSAFEVARDAIPARGIYGGVRASEREGKTTDDLESLLAFARSRALADGLAPDDAFRGVA